MRKSEIMKKLEAKGMTTQELRDLITELSAILASDETEPQQVNEKEGEEQQNNWEKSMKTRVTEVMKEQGIPAHILGYKYVRDAIMMCVEDENVIHYVTKRIYPQIAQKYKTTASRVERAIRHAIEIAWDRGDLESHEKLFGYTIDCRRGKPTNGEFIAAIADYIRMQDES